jgi:hypothetical protein
MATEVQALPKPADIHVQEQIDCMLSGTEILLYIYNAIRDKDYLLIWIYPGSMENLS